jgi:hypothetical protein
MILLILGEKEMVGFCQVSQHSIEKSRILDTWPILVPLRCAITNCHMAVSSNFNMHFQIN